jgi:hypothetical protein
VDADVPLPDELPRRAIDHVDRAALAAGDDDVAPTEAGEDRRLLEVVVEQVVRERLEVPEERAREPVEDDERVGVEVRTRAARPVRIGRRPGERSSSTAGGYQSPPPLFSSGFPQRLRPVVSKRQRSLPVFRSSA